MLMLDVLFYSFTIVVAIQALYYLPLFGWFAFLKQQDKLEIKSRLPISVIVCAKNEAENLKRFIPSLLNQEYPNFEVVLINDNSSDDTLKIMNHFASIHNQIKVVDVKPDEVFLSKKKQALTLGIKASEYDHLLFTDADCEAISPQWIAQMAAHFNEKTKIVLGYGGYFKIKNSFINKLIRYETLLTAIQYFSYSKIGLPYMGVGRNLAYQKALFFKANGFSKHLDVSSGDDDLFINQVASHNNTAICFSLNSITLSEPKRTVKAWITQKRRHVSTAKYYKLKHQFLLGLFYCSQFLFWFLAIALLIVQYFTALTIMLIVIRFAIVLMVLNASAKKLNETNLIVLMPILELFLILTQFGIFIANLISKPKHWK